MGAIITIELLTKGDKILLIIKSYLSPFLFLPV